MTRPRGVLAIDLGSHRTGFASADPFRITRTPLEAIDALEDSEEILDYIADLLAERDVGVLLLGLARHLDGTDTPRATAARRFALRLQDRFPDCEVVLWDEHLTTKEAEVRMKEAGMSLEESRRWKDSWSALVLLEDWLGG